MCGYVDYFVFVYVSCTYVCTCVHVGFIRSNSGFVPSIENTDTHQIMTRLRQVRLSY